MLNIGRNTILPYEYRFVAFGYLPSEGDVFQQVTIFENTSKAQFAICLSTVTNRQRKKTRKELRDRLGEIQPGSKVAPYAHRNLEGPTYEKAKDIINEAFTGMKLQWYK